MKKRTQEEKIIDLLKSLGIVRTVTFTKLGINSKTLSRLTQKGIIERVERGLYSLMDSEISGHETLRQISRKIPSGIICLISAFSYHGITTQNSRKVWIAIERDSWVPTVKNLPVRIFKYSKQTFCEGIEKKKVNGVEVRVYSVARSVADGFKYRNKIGIDIAIEALRDSLNQKKCTRDEVWYYAKICRVQNVIRPYLEATT